MARTDIEVNSRERWAQFLETAIVRITLGVLFLIPLIFPFRQAEHPFGEPKAFILHVGMLVVAVLWVWQKVLLIQHDRKIDHTIPDFSFVAWVGRSPARWAIVTLIVMWIAQIISTLLSPLPAISLFGGDESFSGANLYDSSALLIVFLVVAFKFRTSKTLEQLAWVLIGAATIAATYGIAQHFGWDSFGNRAQSRVPSSFGNTINFSAYLGMAIPVTIAITLRKAAVDRKFEILLGLALALQMAGMWFSASRGPFVGGAAAIAVLLLGVALLRSRPDLIRIGLVTAIGLIGTFIITIIPSSIESKGLTASLSIGSEITNIGSGNASSDGGGGLPGRIQRWRNTLQLATGWDVVQEESSLKRVARPLFGLGPEMYVYSYPLVGDAHPDRQYTAHPHNYPLWILVGQGFIGFGLLITSMMLILWSVWRAVKRLKPAEDGLSIFDWLLIAFAAGFVGKIIETQVGVARISDLSMYFALAGALIAIVEIINSRVPAEQSDDQKIDAKFAISSQTMFRGLIAGALIATVVASWLIVSWDLRRMSASLDITFAETTADGYGEFRGLVNAQDGAPERRNYTMLLAEQYFVSAQQAWQVNQPDEAHGLALAAFELLVEFEVRDPWERNTQLALAKTTSTLVDWGFAEYTNEMRDRYLKVAELFPTYPSLVSTSATALARAGDNAMAIELADRAIATEDSTKPWAVAWYAKGAAFINLGEFENAIESLNTAIEKEPESGSARLAHLALAYVYTQQGETDLAELHTEAANE